MGKTVLGSLLLVLGNAAIAGIGVVVHKLLALVQAKSHNQKVSDIIGRVSDLAIIVVKDVFQSYVSSLKASGSFDAAAQQQAKALALDALKKYLGDAGIKQLAQAIGGSADVTGFLSTAIEAALAEFKTANAPIVKVVPVAPPPPAG